MLGHVRFWPRKPFTVVSFHACSRMRKLTWNNNWSHISLCKSSASYLNSCVRRWAEALRLCLGQPSGLIWLHEECVYTADSSDSRLSFGVFAHIIKRIWQIKKWEKKNNYGLLSAATLPAQSPIHLVNFHPAYFLPDYMTYQCDLQGKLSFRFYLAAPGWT